MDTAYMWNFSLANDACHRLPPNLQFHGFAFACGATRFFVYGTIWLVAIVEAYAVAAVWSYCEELVHDGVGNLGFADLRQDAAEALWRQNKQHYGGILGYSGKTHGPVQVCIGPTYGM